VLSTSSASPPAKSNHPKERRYSYTFAAMPTLVWRVRPVSGTSAAGSGGSSAHQGEATVPDPIVSVSAGPAASSSVAIPADSSNHDADGGKKRKKRKMKSHAEAATAATKKSKAVSDRDLPTGVTKTPSGKFKSRIRWGSRERYIGTFDSSEQASAVYMSVKKDIEDANLSTADDVNGVFDAAQKKAVEAVGGFVIKKRAKATSERDLPTGVSKTSSGKFHARLKWGDNQHYIGTFDSSEQASAAYVLIRKERDNVELSVLGGNEVNAAFDAAQKKAVEAMGMSVPKRKKSKRGKATSERDLPRGIWKTSSGKFQSMITWSGKDRYVGSFDTPEQTSSALISMKKDLYNAELSTLGADEVTALFRTSQKKAVEAVGGFIQVKKRAKASSERDLPTGVSKTSSGTFHARIQWGDKQHSIGTFDSPEQASVAYVLMRKERGDAKLSTLRDDEVNALFKAAKTKAMEAAGVLV